jgi:hypothetical protein
VDPLRIRAARGAAILAASLTLAWPAPADPLRDALLFSITKTENKNFVQYVVRVDARYCAPTGDAPVHAYWRMMEHGPDAIEPLLGREQPAYGVADQRVLSRGADGGAVRVTLRALPHDPMVVETRRTTNGCEARARVPIAGGEARLFNVHAVLAWPFGVSRLVVTGWSLADGHVVREERRP